MIADLPGGATETFTPALNGAIIALGGSQIFIAKELTTDASALTSSITISGNATGNGPTPDDSRVFEIACGNPVVIRGLVIAWARTTGKGGAS